MASRLLTAPMVVAGKDLLRPLRATPVSVGLVVILSSGILAMSLIQIATLQGVGITSDSAIYIDAARHFAAGEGFMQSSPIGAPIPVTHYPPGYPLSLTILMILARVDAPEAARLLGTLLIGLNVILVGDLVTRYARFAWAGPIAALLCALSLDMLRVHATGWSEPLFLTCCLLFVRALSSYLDRPGARALIITALIAAAATLTRYVGVTLIVTGILVVLLLQRSSWRRRITAAFVFSCVSLLVVGMWCSRNKTVGESTTNRALNPAPLTMEEWNDAATTIARWYWPFAHGTVTSRAIAAVVLTVMVVVLFLHNRQWLRGRRFNPSGGRLECLPQVLLLFIGVYVGMVLAAIALIDHSTPLDWRILIPVFASGAVLHLCVMDDLLQSATQHVRVAYVSSAVTLAVLYSIHIAPWVLTASWDDKGFNSPEWKHSSVLAYLKDLPAHRGIVSNATPAIRFHNQRGSYSIPKPAVSELGELSWDFQQVQRLRDRLAARHGVLVFFRVRPAHHYGERQLVRMLGVKRIYQGEDGSVYQLRDPAPAALAPPVSPPRVVQGDG